MRLAAIFPPSQAPERLLPAAAAAEDSGLAELWVWEDCFSESGIATATTFSWTGSGGPADVVVFTSASAASPRRTSPPRSASTAGPGRPVSRSMLLSATPTWRSSPASWPVR